MNRYIMGLHEVQMSDVNQVGGKNASLGEMIKNLTKSGKVKVPGGLLQRQMHTGNFLHMKVLQIELMKH